jgi:hypothetical protein
MMGTSRSTPEAKLANKFKPEEILSSADIARLLGIPQHWIARSIASGLFPYLESPNGHRYVPKRDRKTLALLKTAANMVYERGVNFETALDLLREGLPSIENEQEYAS